MDIFGQIYIFFFSIPILGNQSQMLKFPPQIIPGNLQPSKEKALQLAPKGSPAPI